MVRAGRGRHGGILALLELIDRHRGAFEYDWRTRFHLALSEVGESMTWGEAIRHTTTLAADPSSHICAALGEWDRPVTSIELVLMDLYDLSHRVAWRQAGGKGQRPKPYPRPWPDRKRTRTKPDVSQEEIFAALRFAGHTAPLPTVTGG